VDFWHGGEMVWIEIIYCFGWKASHRLCRVNARFIFVFTFFINFILHVSFYFSSFWSSFLRLPVPACDHDWTEYSWLTVVHLLRVFRSIAINNPVVSVCLSVCLSCGWLFDEHLPDAATSMGPLLIYCSHLLCLVTWSDFFTNVISRYRRQKLFEWHLFVSVC